MEIEDNELLVEREILANGKSRAFVASRPATGALLRNWRRTWAISTASTINSSFFAEAQREMLDAFAEGMRLIEVRHCIRRMARATAELEELERTAQEKLRLADLWSFQRNEIEAVSPSRAKMRSSKTSAACCATW